ncbi:MAG: hypothetical protein KBI35_01845 [Ruminococcus sp.]|nr:hypothetical protein [Ruminococcus sp.]
MGWLKYTALVVVSLAIVGCGKQETISSENSEGVTTTTSTSSTTSTSTTTSTTRTTTSTTTMTTTTTTVPKKAYNRCNDITYNFEPVGYRSSGQCIKYSVYSEPNYNGSVLWQSDSPGRLDSLTIDNYGNFWYSLEDHSGYVVGNEITSPLAQYYNTVSGYYAEEYSGGFVHCDINGDDTEEWIFRSGKNAAEYKYEVFTVSYGEIVSTLCGTIPYGSLWIDNSGNLYTQVEKMGYKTPYKITLNGVNLSTDEIGSLPDDVQSMAETSYISVLGENYTDPYFNNMKGIDASTGKSIHENPAHDTPEPEYVEPITEAPTPSSDPPFNEDEPNVWCPDCGYGFFTTGFGSDGLNCPNCGKNFMPIPQG